MSIDQQFEDGVNLMNRAKYKQAVKQFQSIEHEYMNKGKKFLNQFYYNLGMCAFKSKQYEIAYNSFSKMNQDQPFPKEYWWIVISCMLSSLIFIHKYEQCIQESNELLLSIEDKDSRRSIHFNRGYCHQEQNLYLAAITEYKKAIELGSQHYTNISYCLLRLGKYQEAKYYQDQLKDKIDIQDYLIRSEIYMQEKQEKLAIENLYTAHQLFISHSFDESDFSPEEYEFLKKRLGPDNAENIQRLYEYVNKDQKINDEQVNLMKEFITQVGDKSKQDIQQIVLSQLQELFPKSMLNQISIDKELEEHLQNQLIKEYFQSFLQECDGVFFQAQGIAQGFKKNKDTLSSIGFEVLKMIPLVGSTASTVLECLNDTISNLQLEARSKALLRIGISNNEFQNKLKQQLCLAFKNQSFLDHIKNPKQAEGFKSYIQIIKSIANKVKNEINQQAFGILNEQETDQWILAKKDAQELIGTYYSSGYLRIVNNEQDQNQKCVRYLVASDEIRRIIEEETTEELKNIKIDGSNASTCCNLL